MSDASRVDEAIAGVREWIVEHNFEVGDRIPAERQFAEDLGVSRTVVREALSILEALGQIERRSTLGRFVAGPQPDRSQSLVHAWLSMHSEEIYQVDEIRALVESHIVRNLSVAQCREVVIEGRRIVAEQRKALNLNNIAGAARIDGDFHTALSRRTPNSMLRDLARSFIDSLPGVPLAVYSIPELAQGSLRWHELILDTLENEGPEPAANHVYCHIRESSHRLRDEGMPSLDKPWGDDQAGHDHSDSSFDGGRSARTSSTATGASTRPP